MLMLLMATNNTKNKKPQLVRQFGFYILPQLVIYQITSLPTDKDSIAERVGLCQILSFEIIKNPAQLICITVLKQSSI